MKVQHNSKDRTKQKATSTAKTDVYVWGSDHAGQLGLGNKQQQQEEIDNPDRNFICYALPKLCSYNLLITQIACANQHAVFLTSHGYVYSVGSNAHGQLGLGDHSNHNSKYSNDSLLHSTRSPCLVQALSKEKCIFVSCGKFHTIAITKQGQPYSWGYNSHGQLGTGDQIDRFVPTKMDVSFEDEHYLKEVRQYDKSSTVKYINSSCGSNHTLLVSSTNEVYGCGSNQNGQLGLIDITNNNTTIHQSNTQQNITSVSLFLQNLQIKNKITSTACGNSHSLVLDIAGVVYSSGSNEHCELGRVIRNHQQNRQKDYDNQDQQFSHHQQQMIAVDEQQCDYQFKQINNNAIRGSKFTMIAACQYQSLAMTQEGEVFIWGRTNISQYSHPIKILPKQSSESNKSKKSLAIPVFRSASLGDDYGVCVDNLGGVWTWGDNSYGQLAQGQQQQQQTQQLYEFSVSPVLVKALKNRPVEAVSCGAGFVWALGKKTNKINSQGDHSKQSKEQQQQQQSNKPQNSLTNHSTIERGRVSEDHQKILTKSQTLSRRSNTKSRSNSNKQQSKMQATPKKYMKGLGQVNQLISSRSRSKGKRQKTVEQPKDEQIQQQQEQINLLRKQQQTQATKQTDFEEHQAANSNPHIYHISPKLPLNVIQHSDNKADQYNDERESMRVERQRIRIEREVFQKDKELLSKQIDMLTKNKQIMEQQINFWKGQKNLNNNFKDDGVNNNEKQYYLRFIESQQIITSLQTQLAQLSSDYDYKIQNTAEQLRILRQQSFRDISDLKRQLGDKDQWINRLSQEITDLIGIKERQQQNNILQNEFTRYYQNCSNDKRYYNQQINNVNQSPEYNTFVSQTLPSFAQNNINTNIIDTVADSNQITQSNYNYQQYANTGSDNNNSQNNKINNDKSNKQSLLVSTKQGQDNHINYGDYFEDNKIDQSLVDSHIFSLSQPAGGSQVKHHTPFPLQGQNSKNNSLLLMSTQKRLFSEGNNNNNRNSPFSQSLQDSPFITYGQRQLLQQQKEQQTMSDSVHNNRDQNQKFYSTQNAIQSPLSTYPKFQINHSRFNSAGKMNGNEIQVEKLNSASAKKLFHLLEETNSNQNIPNSLLSKSAVLDSSQALTQQQYENQLLKLDNSNLISQFVVSRRCSVGERSRTSASFELTDVKKRLADMRKTSDSLLLSDMKSFDRKVNLTGNIE